MEILEGGEVWDGELPDEQTIYHYASNVIASAHFMFAGSIQSKAAIYSLHDHDDHIIGYRVAWWSSPLDYLSYDFHTLKEAQDRYAHFKSLECGDEDFESYWIKKKV